MKKSLLFIVLCLLALAAFAQQDAQFTQNMLMKLPTNPGYAGTRDVLCGTTAYRTQWVGFAGAPKTFVLTADMPVRDLNGGVGLTVMKDKLGNFNFTHARGAYSYHLPVQGGIGLLGLGLEVGMMQASVENNWLAPNGTHGESDDWIPQHPVQKTAFDAGAGLYYRTDRMYLGFSASHAGGKAHQLNALEFSYKSARHYFLQAGYNFQPLPRVMIRPSVFAKFDGAVAVVDINCNALFDEFVWGGFSFRPGDALAPMAGVAFQPGGQKSAAMLKIGYSYDIGMSDLKAHHDNTHEIVVSYCIKWGKPIASHKHPRLMGDDRPVKDPPFSAPYWYE